MPPQKTPEMVTKLLKDAVSLKGQSAVARETGLTQPAISRYLRGIGEPTTDTFKKLSDYFGVSVAVLRGDGLFSERTFKEAGFAFDQSVSAFDKFGYFKMQEFNAALDDSFPESSNVIYLSFIADTAKDLLSLPEHFYKNISCDAWEALKKKAKAVIDRYKDKLSDADEETRTYLLSIDLRNLTEKNNFYDLTTASDYYARLTSTFDIIFGLSLTSKHAHENKLFLSVSVSLAKLVRDMPQEFKDIYDADYINELSDMARDVIKKFSADKLLERFKQPAATPKLRNN